MRVFSNPACYPKREEKKENGMDRNRNGQENNEEGNP